MTTVQTSGQNPLQQLDHDWQFVPHMLIRDTRYELICELASYYEPASPLLVWDMLRPTNKPLQTMSRGARVKMENVCVARIQFTHGSNLDIDLYNNDEGLYARYSSHTANIEHHGRYHTYTMTNSDYPEVMIRGTLVSNTMTLQCIHVCVLDESGLLCHHQRCNVRIIDHSPINGTPL